MNTGSRDEREMLANVARIAAALERIAASMEATALREYGPVRPVYFRSGRDAAEAEGAGR